MKITIEQTLGESLEDIIERAKDMAKRYNTIISIKQYQSDIKISRYDSVRSIIDELANKDKIK